MSRSDHIVKLYNCMALIAIASYMTENDVYSRAHIKYDYNKLCVAFCIFNLATVIIVKK